jgi:hypothetical protein
MSMKKFNDTIGDQTRDLPACNQLRHRVSHLPLSAKPNFRVFVPYINPILNHESVTMCFRRRESEERRVRQETYSGKLLKDYVVFMVCLCDMFVR